MAWGNKKRRELEYQKSGQSAALKVGDLGASDVYDTEIDDFKASWELEPDDLNTGHPRAINQRLARVSRARVR